MGGGVSKRNNNNTNTTATTTTNNSNNQNGVVPASGLAANTKEKVSKDLSLPLSSTQQSNNDLLEGNIHSTQNRSDLTAYASYNSDGRKSDSRDHAYSGSSNLGSQLRMRHRIEAIEKREMMSEAQFNRQRRSSMDVFAMKEALARQAEIPSSGQAPSIRRASSVKVNTLKRQSSLSARTQGPLERQRSAIDRFGSSRSVGNNMNANFTAGGHMMHSSSAGSTLSSSGNGNAQGGSHAMLMGSRPGNTDSRGSNTMGNANLLYSSTVSSIAPGGNMTNKSSGSFNSNSNNPSAMRLASGYGAPPNEDAQVTFLKNRLRQLDEQMAKIRHDQAGLLQTIQAASRPVGGPAPDSPYFQIMQQQLQQNNHLLDSLLKQQAQVEQTMLFILRSNVPAMNSWETGGGYSTDVHNLKRSTGSNTASSAAAALKRDLSDSAANSENVLFF